LVCSLLSLILRILNPNFDSVDIATLYIWQHPTGNVRPQTGDTARSNLGHR